MFLKPAFNVENELYLEQHKEHVHEYGEMYELYPCDECGIRGTDVTSIRKHIEEEHRLSDSESNLDFEAENDSEADLYPLGELGIIKLPVISQTIKQNLKEICTN